MYAKKNKPMYGKGGTAKMLAEYMNGGMMKYLDGGISPRKVTSRQTLRPGMEYEYANLDNRQELIDQGFKFRTTPQGKTVVITPDGDKAVYKDRGELGTELKFKQRMALGGLVKKYENGGLEGDPPMTAEELRALRNALLSGSVDEMPQAEGVVTAGQGSSTSVAMPGAPGEPLEPIRDPEPQRSQDPERPEDLEPLTPIGMRPIKRDDNKELQKTSAVDQGSGLRGQVSYETKHGMKTGAIPIHGNIWNPETKKYEMYPLSAESIATYIMENQIPKRVNPNAFDTFEDALEYAQRITDRYTQATAGTQPEKDLYDFPNVMHDRKGNDLNTLYKR